VEALRRVGSRSGQTLAHLRAHIDRPIAAILTLNTISNSAGAMYAGALVQRHVGAEWVTLFAVCLTFAILFFSEIIPKTLGAVHASSIAPHAAWFIDLLVRVFWPFVWLCRHITRWVGGGLIEHVASEDDLLAMAQHGAKHGELLPEEARWVANALRLDSVSARDLMTPRPVVYSLPVDMPLGAIKTNSAHWVHSRLPLVKDDKPDEVEGVVLRRDVFDALVEGRVELTMRDLMKPALFVPDTMPANMLLRTFIHERQHLAVVVDEFGGLSGVITLEDVLEELLGEEIVDEHDVHVDMQEFARRRAARRLQARAPSASSPNVQSPQKEGSR